jgi:hypothetical protein
MRTCSGDEIADLVSCWSLQSQLEKIAPTWSDVSIKMKDDPDTDRAFGWVLEMYVKFRRRLLVYRVCKSVWYVGHFLPKL